MMYRLILSTLLLLGGNQVFGSVAYDDSRTAAVLNSDEVFYDLTRYADILEDEQGSLSLQDILSGKYDENWIENKQDIPNFAFSRSTYWVRLHLTSDIDQEKSWLFEIAFPLYDYIDFYLLDGNQVLKTVKTGDRRPFHSRPYDYRNFLFDIPVPGHGSRTIYLRLAAKDGLHEPLPLLLWDKQAFALENTERNFGLGIYFGIMAVMVLYNLFVYSSVRDRTYLYYVGYIGFFALWLFAYYGFAYQYLWPDYPVIANQGIVILICFWGMFICQFVRAYLDTEKNSPRIDRFAKYLAVLLLLVMVASSFDHYAMSILAVIGVGGPACLVAIVAGAVSLKQGYRPARYFLIAWTTLLLSITIFCLKAGGLLPPSWLIERSVQIGSTIEVVLLSLGLADRINVLKKQTGEAQQRALTAGKETLKLRNDFITAVSHELRTPMNALLGGLQLAKQKFGDNLATPYDIIEAGSNNMMKLTGDILTYTEIQSGNINLNLLVVNIHQLLNEVEDVHRPIAESKGLTFVFQVDTDMPVWIKTDPDKITAILRHIIDNAIKFTETGTVEFTAKAIQCKNQWDLQLIVKDSGVGIPADSQVQIFEAFTQAETGFQRGFGGLGIGLSICHSFINLMGGELELESAVGVGSLFQIQVPFRPAKTPAMPSRPALTPEESLILVVEDNSVNQLIIVKMLNSLGLESTVAEHGAEALEILKKGMPVSLVLMDLQMPVMDGFDCAMTIRKKENSFYDLPIIALSANLLDKDRHRCIVSGMDDFLEKPVSLSQLHQSLGHFIRFDTDQTGKREKP